MKYLLLCGLCLISMAASAASLQTKSGKQYEDYSIVKCNFNGVEIEHRTGAATIPFAELPDELRLLYKKEEDFANKRKLAIAARRKKLQAQSTSIAPSPKNPEENVKAEEPEPKRDMESPAYSENKSRTSDESKTSSPVIVPDTKIDPPVENKTYSDGSRTIYTGPRGGRYYINKNGNKTYLRKKK